jgi:hypothetical protein
VRGKNVVKEKIDKTLKACAAGTGFFTRVALIYLHFSDIPELFLILPYFQ